MRLIVNSITAFGFSKNEAMWGVSFANLNWMMMEYNNMHSKKEEKEEMSDAKKDVIALMKEKGMM